MRLSKGVIAGIIGIIAVTASLIVILNLDKIFDSNSSSSKKGRDVEKEYTSVTIDGEKYSKRNTLNYLIIGIDQQGEAESSGTFTNEGLADFIAILSFNRDLNTYSIMHINRDTNVTFNRLGIDGKKVGEINGQICLSHRFGSGLKDSCFNTQEAVQSLVYDLYIDGFISMQMSALPKLNDYFAQYSVNEGVEITLDADQDLSNVNPLWKPNATIYLRGQDALTFVRARTEVEDGTNIKRMRRQQQYISSFINLVKSLNGTLSSSEMIESFDQISDECVTNIGETNLSTIFDYIMEYQYNGILSPAGETKLVGEGEDERVMFYADQNSLKEISTTLFYEKQDK